MTDKQPDSIQLSKDLTLGKHVSYVETYSPELLQPVPRSVGREAISLPYVLPFDGVDIWNGYELSWLNEKGKPVIAILQCEVPIDSPNLIESKSFKLYLNSFNQSTMSGIEHVQSAIEKDLSKCAGAPVVVKLYSVAEFNQLHIGEFDGTVIDDLDVEITDYQPNADTLAVSPKAVSETLVSHLLKSNCLITSQPDWASVIIRYSGNKICHESLLKYIVSFRQHNEFHEQCVERLYYDIMTQCKPTELTVYARYTRRGGLDINPFRSNFEKPYSNCRLARQ